MYLSRRPFVRMRLTKRRIVSSYPYTASNVEDEQARRCEATTGFERASVCYRDVSHHVIVHEELGEARGGAETAVQQAEQRGHERQCAHAVEGAATQYMPHEPEHQSAKTTVLHRLHRYGRGDRVDASPSPPPRIPRRCCRAVATAAFVAAAASTSVVEVVEVGRRQSTTAQRRVDACDRQLQHPLLAEHVLALLNR